MAVPRALAPLKYRPFALLWSGAFLSNIGNWMETITVGVYVQRTTGQAGWTGLVAGAAFIPNALFGPVGGALADRLPRKPLLVVANAVQALLAGTLAVLITRGTATPGMIAVIVFIAGCVGATQFPAYQSILPDLVPVEVLPGAVALSSTQWNLGRVIGPALAGIVITIGGYGWALGLNTLSFLAPLVVVLILHIPPPATKATESLWQSMREGFDFARTEPGLRVALQFLAVAALLAAPFIALVPAISDKVLHAETAHHGTAWLVTAQGLGAVVAGLLLGGVTERFGVRNVLLRLMLALPFTLLLYAQAPNLWFAVPAIFLVGGVYLGVLATSTTVAQLRAPAAMRGRALSLFIVVLGLLYPVGAALQGRLGDTFGLRAVTAAAAIAYGLVVWITWLVRPTFLDALNDPVLEGAPAEHEHELGVTDPADPVAAPGSAETGPPAPSATREAPDLNRGSDRS